MEASRSKFEAWAQGTSVCEHCDKHRLELSTGVVVGFCYHKAADLRVRQAAQSLPCESCISSCSALQLFAINHCLRDRRSIPNCPSRSVEFNKRLVIP